MTVEMARYFTPWNHRERAYYALMFSPQFRELMPWWDWFPSLASLTRSVFPWCLIEPGDTVVQVGANWNTIDKSGASQTFLLAQHVGESGRVIGVDSEAKNVDAYERAKVQARTPWVEMLQYAVSDHAGTIEGIDVRGHAYFYDPSQVPEPSKARVAAGASSRERCDVLRDLWDEIQTTGVAHSVPCERLDKILASVNAKPSFVNLTINGYEATGIRGMGDLLDEDVTIAFIARAPEPFWNTGFLEELEGHGFSLVLSNTPHHHEAAWFPYLTAVRPHRLKVRPNLIDGRLILDEAQQVLGFVDENGQRVF